MTTPAYDDANIFAKILRGEIPAVKLFEDDAVLAIMDVMPQTEGHVLVIPKAASRNVLDADPAVLAALAPRVQKIARAVKTALGAEGITIMQFNEPAGGQTVFHLHVHILPRFAGVELNRHAGGMAKPETLIPVRDRIAAALAAA
ncbi:HIT family protein [Methylocella sp.]|uniref:HIT family protein n=1 Tax=Methylocella sp. TaxID=1978226 RepID=UPI0037838487